MTGADQGGWDPPLSVEEVTTAFLLLPPGEQDLFCLVRIDGLSHEEAAQRYGISVKRFQTRLARILGHLRHAVERARKRRR